MRTILIVGVVLLVTLAATVLPKHQGNVGIAQTSEMVDNTYDVLRRQALTLDAAKMGIAGGDNIWAVIMDLPVSSAIATVVAFADGSASIYLSSGGGFIGGGQKPPVRQAAQTLVAAGAAARASFTPTTTFPLPAAGQVRFYARAGVGVLVADASEEALKSGRHALSPLFMAAQRIITAYRGLESKKP